MSKVEEEDLELTRARQILKDIFGDTDLVESAISFLQSQRELDQKEEEAK
jgi:hypothetical protein